MKPVLKKRWLIITIILILGVCLLWLASSDNPSIWTIRNTLQYKVLVWWQGGQIALPSTGFPGTLQGVVYDRQGQPIEGATLLVARRDGTTYSTRSQVNGDYKIEGIPSGTYQPVAGAPGYESVQFGGWLKNVTIRSGAIHQADVTLPHTIVSPVTLGQDLWLTEAETLACTSPIESEALRHQIHFKSEGQANQAAFYYTPVTATLNSDLPVLFAIYPGPADSWECASVPLTSAGYAVIATGPAYSFNLEHDLDELERLIQFVKNGDFPGSSSHKMAILGGSYSSLHVQRLLERGQRPAAAVLLGAPTDLFDIRHRLEEGTYIPPFGLDQALIALGLPDKETLRYWRYSGAYHVHSDFPPLAIFHSRNDAVVPYQQSELLTIYLDYVGVPYELHLFDASSHYLLSDESDAIYDLALTFLDKHLNK